MFVFVNGVVFNACENLKIDVHRQGPDDEGLFSGDGVVAREGRVVVDHFNVARISVMTAPRLVVYLELREIRYDW